MNNREQFLKDMTLKSKYTFLDEGKDKGELEEIANKRGIKLPCHDLSVFKCTYAYVDVANKNGCILVKAEVEKSLDSLVGKAVDFDHLRKRVVGHWIDAKIEKDEIIAYGVFYKGNFDEDYVLIKEMMEKDVLAISFEAWGTKEVLNSEEYNLNDLEFAGGALLIKTSPAFPGSEVLEMSKQERILEFASIMTVPTEFLHKSEETPMKEEKPIEKSQLYLEQIQSIQDVLASVECPSCKEKSLGTIQMIDLEQKVVRVKCYSCEAIVKADLTPAVELVKKGKKIEKSDIKVTIEKNEDNKKMKEKEQGTSLNENVNAQKQQFTVKCNSCGYTFQSDVRGESTQCTKCGGTTVTVGTAASGVITKSQEEEKGMKEKIEKLEKELATLKEANDKVVVELTEKSDSLTTANATIDELKKESEDAKVKIEEIEKAKTIEIEEAKANAVKSTERKSELGEEFAKDVDLLNDSDYELAKAKKELAAKDAEIASLKENKPIEKDLSKGSEDKSVDDEIKTKRTTIQSIAFGKKE